MNNDFYNRVFLSNKLLNTTTVQPVVRPAKVDENENFVIEKKIEGKNNQQFNIFSKIENLEKKIKFLEEKVNELEDKIQDKNIVEFELNEFDKMIVKDDPETV